MFNPCCPGPVWETPFLKMGYILCLPLCRHKGVSGPETGIFDIYLTKYLTRNSVPHQQTSRALLRSTIYSVTRWLTDGAQWTLFARYLLPTQVTCSALVSAHKLQWNRSQHRLGTAAPRPHQLHSCKYIQQSTRQDKTIWVICLQLQHIFTRLLWLPQLQINTY